MTQITLGQRISTQRKKLGMSQEALAEKLEVSRQAVSKWESDGAIPEIDKLIALCRIYQVTIGWLLGVENDSPTEAIKENVVSPSSVTIIIRYDL